MPKWPYDQDHGARRIIAAYQMERLNDLAGTATVT
jgi:hypothetical protein